MATWANAHANIMNTGFATTDGIAIYGINDGGSGNWTIEKYEPLNGDATSTIAPSTSLAVGQDTIWGDPDNFLTWFKGRLYNVKHQTYAVGSASHRIDIYRWGGGASWQLVESITPTSIVNDPLVSFIGNADFQAAEMRHSTPNLFVVWANVADSSSAAEIIYTRYSTDGVNWTTAVLNVTGASFFLNYHEQARIFAEFTAGGSDKVYEFTGGAWVERLASLGTDVLDTTDKVYLWRANSTRTSYQYSTDGITYTAPSDTAVQPCSTNMVAPIGAKDTASNLYLNLWDPATNQWDGSASEVIAASGVGALSCDNFIRVADGNVFAHIFDGGVPIWRTRSAPLGGPGQPDEEDIYATGQFYYGKGELIRRSDTPIPGVNIDGMARVGKHFYIGSKTPNGVMVARATAAPYTSWEDRTAGLGMTAVKSFSGTPWADAEDIEEDKDTGDEGFAGGPGGKCD